MNNITRLVVVVGSILLSLLPALSHDHLKTGYVPWGVDEYELFGLTKAQLAKKYKSELHFNYEFTEAYLTSQSYGPRFLLTYDHDHVDKVQRMFIDACGCHIMGPLLNSKVEALKFSIDGLSALPNGGDQKDHQRLLSAKKLLNDCVSSKKL